MLTDLHQRILINLKLLEHVGQKRCTTSNILKKNYHSHVDPWPTEEGLNCAIAELKSVGLLEPGKSLKLTSRGTAEADQVFEQFLAKTMIRSMNSETLHRFRETLYGMDLYQYNITTRNQFLALKNYVQPGSGKKLLDLGCGLGGTAQYFAGFGATVHGVDLVQELIEYNQKRLSHFPTLTLSFETADIGTYLPAAESVDVIYSIDAFQFLPLPALCRTFPRLLDALKPGGKFAILCSQLVPQSDFSPKPRLASPKDLLVGKALETLNIPYTTVDFSDEYLPFWQRCALIVEDLKTDFFEEGFESLYQERRHESARILNQTLQGKNSFGRYLYLIHKG